MNRKSKLLIILMLLYSTSSFANNAWQKMAEDIVTQIDQAVSFYVAGNLKSAAQAVVKAYFGIFEDRKMEAAIRVTLGSKHAYLVERLFGKLRKAIKKDKGSDVVRRTAQEIRDAVRKDAKILDKKNISLNVFQPNQ